jgi:uncharacterized membrane protein
MLETFIKKKEGKHMVTYLHKFRGDLLHLGFEIALLLKAVNGVFEIIGGVLLMFASSSYINHIAVLLTQSELSEDPNDAIANAILTFSQSYSVSAQNFGIFYLMSHGIIKLIMVVLLWQKRLWAYPLMIFFLSLFIAYQAYRYTIDHSFMMILLTILDLVVVFLTFVEYKRAIVKVDL